MDNLRLRNFREDDFEAFHAICSDYDVVKMVASWPYPADPEFSIMRMNTPEAKAGTVSVIECNGAFAGSIGGVRGGVGYMLGKEFWGRGIATWALGQKVNEMFRAEPIEKILGGVWIDNPASAAVMCKNGFRKVATSRGFCKARNCEQDGLDFELSRGDWAATQPLRLETDRLVIEPFSVDDAADLSRLMNDVDIARMMQTFPHPFSKETAVDWIKKRPFEGKVGFAAKITLNDGTLIGFLGLGGDPLYAAYAFGREFWGQGYATEAMQAFLKYIFEVYALEEVNAGAFMDNPASQRVLEKLGFEKSGQKMHTAHGRLEEAPLILYRLHTANFGTS